MLPGTIDDSARRIAHARWLELRCFEVLGGWVASTPEPEVKLALARQSHHHAWHAELFERVLPVANGLDPHRHDEPPDPWRDLLAHLEGLEQTADRLVGAYGLLLPAKLAEYEDWLASADPVREAPLRRWLGFVVADERADLAEGRALLQGLRAADAAPARAGFEAALVRAGSLLG
ncbi:MAG: hypothetical protein WDA60_02120 [Acidimicrobiia bacterium]|jgi:hypothetical protein